MIPIWKDIRARAAAFAEKWRNASYEKGETQSFYNDFFEIFGVSRASVGRYEEHVAKRLGKRGFADLFWPEVPAETPADSEGAQGSRTRRTEIP